MPARWRAPNGASSSRQAHHEQGCGLPDRDGVLAWLPELRPVPCDRVVQGQLPRSANWCTSNATKGLLAEKIQNSVSGRQPNALSRTTSPWRSTHNCVTAPRALTKSTPWDSPAASTPTSSGEDSTQSITPESSRKPTSNQRRIQHGGEHPASALNGCPQSDSGTDPDCPHQGDRLDSPVGAPMNVKAR